MVVHMQKRSESEKNGYVNQSRYDEVSRVDTEETFQNNDWGEYYGNKRYNNNYRNVV